MNTTNRNKAPSRWSSAHCWAITFLVSLSAHVGDITAAPLCPPQACCSVDTGECCNQALPCRACIFACTQQGPGTMCNATAACWTTEGCVEVAEICCDDIGGCAAGSSCASPPALQACEFSNPPACTDMPASCCQELGGTPRGLGSSCGGSFVWYVKSDASGTGDGKSWVNAFPFLQDALDAAGPNDEIWVAAGTYYPGCTAAGGCSQDRTATFDISQNGGLKLYGGFAGTESTRVECSEPGGTCGEVGDPCGTSGICLDNRAYACHGGDDDGRPCDTAADCRCTGTCDPAPTCEANPTILSGDVDGNDTAPGTCTYDSDCGTVCNNNVCTYDQCTEGSECLSTICDPPDCKCLGVESFCVIRNHCLGDRCVVGKNAYHVVTYNDASVEAIVDGFIIGNGKADGPAIDNQGGAVQIRAADLCLPGGPVLRNCLVRNNYAGAHGAVNDHGSSTVIDNCVFVDNLAEHEGGALVIDNGAADVQDSLFLRNRTNGGEGGAVWIASRPECVASPPTIDRCEFVDNGGGSKGGALWIATTSAKIRQSRFEANGLSGAIAGGAVYAERAGSLQDPLLFEDCDFIKNQAYPESSAAYFFDNTVVDVIRCRFEGNRFSPFTEYVQSTIYVYQNTIAHFRNTVFLNNTATTGSVIWLNRGATAELDNCTIVGNSDTDGAAIRVDNLDDNFVTLRNSIVWNNTTDFSEPPGQANIKACYSILCADPAGGLCDASAPANIHLDPLLIDDEDGGDGFDLHLSADSPAINSGCTDDTGPACTPPSCPGCATDVGPYDVAGDARVQCSVIDIGAYEYAGCDPTCQGPSVCCTGMPGGREGEGCPCGDVCCDGTCQAPPCGP